MPFPNLEKREIHPDHKRASVRSENPSGPTTTEPFAPKHCTSSRLIPMVMRLPISPTECASPLSSAAHKPRVSAALMARKPLVPAMAGK